MKSIYTTLCFQIFILICMPVYGAIIYVPGDYGTIQDALDAAMPADTVLVANGVYSGSGNVELDFAGKDIVLESENGASYCVIDGGGVDRAIVFDDGESDSAVLNGFTIDNCAISGMNSTGGGISIVGSSPTINNCVFHANTAEYGGGAIASSGGGTPAVINSRFYDNGNVGNRGGAIYSDEGSIIIDGCIFETNTSSNKGGAISICAATSSAIITDCEITDNLSGRGGGVEIYECMTSPVYIDRCLVSENSSTDGAGIYLNTSWVYVTNSIFTENWASLKGGGIQLIQCVDSKIYNCLIYDNRGSNGAGVYCDADAEIVNCTASFNQGTGNGAGFYFFLGNPVLKNSIVCMNDAISWIEIADLSGGTLEVTYSNVCQPSGLWPGIGNIREDPMFRYGPMGGFYLSQIASGHSENSPCVDSGSDLASSICFPSPNGMECMSDFFTRVDHVTDSGMIDMGFHFDEFGLPQPPEVPALSIYGIFLVVAVFGAMLIRKR